MGRGRIGFRFGLEAIPFEPTTNTASGNAGEPGSFRNRIDSGVQVTGLGFGHTFMQLHSESDGNSTVKNTIFSVAAWQ